MTDRADPPERCRPATDAQHEQADNLFDRLSEALTDAAESGEARDIRRADRAFSALHGWLSRGGALPSPWRSARH